VGRRRDDLDRSQRAAGPVLERSGRGVPPYAVFTNEQLAEMVRRPVQTLAGLAGIDGVGAARVEKYGPAVLEILRVAPRGPAPPPATDPEA